MNIFSDISHAKSALIVDCRDMTDRQLAVYYGCDRYFRCKLPHGSQIPTMERTFAKMNKRVICDGCEDFSSR